MEDIENIKDIITMNKRRIKSLESDLKAVDKTSAMGLAIQHTIDVRKTTVNALEKQVPKQIVGDGMRIPFSYYCPACKEELSDDGYKYDDAYCPYCGQRLI